jgi:hypothetical protein
MLDICWRGMTWLDGVVLWLEGGKMETRLSDGRVNKVEMTFYSSGGWELDHLVRVIGGGGVNLMF